jgi:hypothetical protein
MKPKGTERLKLNFSLRSRGRSRLKHKKLRRTSQLKNLQKQQGKYSTRVPAPEKSEYFFQSDSDKIGRQMSKNFHCARGYVAAKTANKEF